MHLIGRKKPEQSKILSEFHKSILKCLSTTEQEMTNCSSSPQQLADSGVSALSVDVMEY